jgi:hypothetical protein
VKLRANDRLDMITFALSGLTRYLLELGRGNRMSEEDGQAYGPGDQMDEARIRNHLGKMVRGTVEKTLNAMLDAEADRLCGAGPRTRPTTFSGMRVAMGQEPPASRTVALREWFLVLT